MPPFEDIPAIYPSFNLIPNENPLSDGGKWTNYSIRPPLKVSSGGGAIHGTVEFPPNGSVYIAEVFNGSTIEAYGCTPGSGLGAAVETHRIVALIGDPDNYIGYMSAYGGGIGQEYFMRRYSGNPGSWTVIGDDGAANGGAGQGAPAPSKLGIRVMVDRVEQWGYYGVTPTWHLIQTAFDTTYRGPTYIALETEEQGGIEEVAWSCFGAGVPNRTQIYRILRDVAQVEATI